jgi:hypothetical protein
MSSLSGLCFLFVRTCSQAVVFYRAAVTVRSRLSCGRLNVIKISQSSCLTLSHILCASRDYEVLIRTHPWKRAINLQCGFAGVRACDGGFLDRRVVTIPACIFSSNASALLHAYVPRCSFLQLSSSKFDFA